MNPLQSEQTKIGQLGTMAFSVGISLALGAFVPVRIGFYWICSNLLTIAQQSMLNIINPHKYIDHETLEKSRKQLDELHNIDGKKKCFAINPHYTQYPMEPLNIVLCNQIGQAFNLDEISRAEMVVNEMLRNGDKYQKQISDIRKDLMPKFGNTANISYPTCSYHTDRLV